MRAAAAAILVVIGCAAMWATAQDDRPVFRGGVQLIDVDAVVTDRDGNAVRDLTRDDFEIFDEGRAQTVRAFAFVDLPFVARPDRESAPPEIEPDVVTNAGADGRLYVLLLDAPSAPVMVPPSLGDYSYTVRAKQVAQQFVRTVVQPGDQVAVVHVQGTFTDSQPFTTSRRLIEASIERYGRGRSGVDSLGDGEQLTRTRDTYRAIEDLSARLGTIRGRRKAIIWIGGQIDIFPARQTDRHPTPENSVKAGSLMFGYRDAMRAAARNGVAIYPIDPTGATTELGEDEMLRMGGLRAVAEDTGGLAVVNTSNFTGGFTEVMRDLSTYYLLGFEPDRDDRGHSFHSIRVRVKRPGVVVRARTGYYADASTRAVPRPALPRGVSAAAADALARPVPTRGLRVDVVTSAFKTTRRESTVVVGAHVDGQMLQLVSGASLTVSYRIFDVEGRAAAGAYKVFDLNLQPASRGHVVEDGLRFVERVSLRPGRYELRLVAEQPNVALGSVIASFEVPKFDEPLAMSGVVLASHGQRALSLTHDATLRDALEAEPTVARRFTRADTVSAFAEIYAERSDEAVSVVGTLTTSAGAEIARVAADSVAPLPGSHTGAHGYRVNFDLRDVPPGEYVLTVEASSGRQVGHSVRREIPIAVGK